MRLVHRVCGALRPRVVRRRRLRQALRRCSTRPRNGAKPPKTTNSYGEQRNMQPRIYFEDLLRLPSPSRDGRPTGNTTFSGGCLGSQYDEERSEVR